MCVAVVQLQGNEDTSRCHQGFLIQRCPQSAHQLGLRKELPGRGRPLLPVPQQEDPQITHPHSGGAVEAPPPLGAHADLHHMGEVHALRTLYWASPSLTALPLVHQLEVPTPSHTNHRRWPSRIPWARGLIGWVRHAGDPAVSTQPGPVT